MASKFIKQQVKHGANNIAFIRGDHYGDSLAWLLEMFEEAKRDYPEIDTLRTCIVKYGGNTINGMFGLEFYPNRELEGYDIVSEVPLIK